MGLFGSKNLDKSIDKDFNLLVFTMLIVAFFGSIFVAIKGVSSGFTVAMLFLGGIVVMSLLFIFVKDDSLSLITKYIGIPLSTNLPLTGLLYVVGSIVPVIMAVASSLAHSSFSVTSFSIPLFASDIVSTTQSFATSSISGSEPWKLFIMSFVAGTNETWLFNMITPMVMIVIGLLLFELLTDNKDYLLFIPKKGFVLGFAFLMSSGIFTVLHTMNATYNSTSMYVYAFVFLLVVNLSIYLAGVWLSFWIGWHQMNNIIYLVQVDGLQTVLTGLLSLFGIIYVGLMILIVFYVIRQFAKYGIKAFTSKH